MKEFIPLKKNLKDLSNLDLKKIRIYFLYILSFIFILLLFMDFSFSRLSLSILSVNAQNRHVVCIGFYGSSCIRSAFRIGAVGVSCLYDGWGGEGLG